MLDPTDGNYLMNEADNSRPSDDTDDTDVPLLKRNQLEPPMPEPTEDDDE